MPPVLPCKYVPDLVHIVASVADAALSGAGVWSRAAEVHLAHYEIRQLLRLTVDGEAKLWQAEEEVEAAKSKSQVVYLAVGDNLGGTQRCVLRRGVVQVRAQRQPNRKRRVLLRPGVAPKNLERIHRLEVETR